MPYAIDAPVGQIFDKPVVSVVGWVADPQACRLVSFLVAEQPVPYIAVPRRDVREALPGYDVAGFILVLDLSRFVRPGVSRVTVKAVRDADVLMSAEFTVADGLAGACQKAAQAQAAKRKWCLEHLRCPHCASPALHMRGNFLACDGCATAFPQDTGALNLLSPELYAQCSLQNSSRVSTSHYDDQGYEIVRDVAARGGRILDCGAGLRCEPEETVINLEIVDFPLCDVLGVGQSLPFADGVFDAVFSFAVLEHVADPFRCAAEMIRVLKPGGRIYAHVPFLQPEHACPNHFYNMTRWGVARLFEGLQIERQYVPRTGVPMWSLYWMVEWYAAHLPAAARENFLSMQVRDLLSKRVGERLDDPIVTALSEEGNWLLASTTAIVLSKPAALS
jgi:SAM-dependent methyltransferase